MGEKIFGERRGGKQLRIDEIRTLKAKAPRGSRFWGYVHYDVQDLVIMPRTGRYRRERWRLANGSVLLSSLPEDVSGSNNGADLRWFLVDHHHHERLPQARLLEQVQEYEVVISAGEIEAILKEEAQWLSAERTAIFMDGVTHSPFIQADDIGALHQGRNGYYTHNENPCFAAFFNTQGKSQANFLNLNCGGRWIFRADQVAIERMLNGGLSQHTAAIIFQLPFEKAQHVPLIFAQRKWRRHLKRRVLNEREQAIASEAALYATALTIISPEMVFVRVNAGKFLRSLSRPLLGACRAKIHQLIPRSDEHRAQQERVRNQIWQMHDALKRYKKAPKKFLADRLRLRFDTIFTQVIGYQKIVKALKRIHDNRSEILFVLDRPEIPLHNNESELDLREYVIRKKGAFGFHVGQIAEFFDSR